MGLGLEIGPQRAPGPERPIQSADRSPATWGAPNTTSAAGQMKQVRDRGTTDNSEDGGPLHLVAGVFQGMGNLSTRCAMKCRERALGPPPALIGTDESPAGYSLTGCTPALPASASPVVIRMQYSDRAG